MFHSSYQSLRSAHVNLEQLTANTHDSPHLILMNTFTKKKKKSGCVRNNDKEIFNTQKGNFVFLSSCKLRFLELSLIFHTFFVFHKNYYIFSNSLNN